MLSQPMIQRFFEHYEHDRMLQGLASNGTPLPLPLRVRLSCGPIAATALGLRRLVELTYGPTPLSRRMTDALLDQQRPDGGFGLAGPSDPLMTAAAVAALGRVIEQHPAARRAEIETARQRALAALAVTQGDHGLFHGQDDRTEAERALVSAFILFLLASDAGFRETVRFAELMTWFDERADLLEPAVCELWTIARLDERPAALPDYASAGLAA